MDKAIEVKPLDLPPGASPGISGLDLIQYLPLVMKVLAALAAAAGTFSTSTPMGKRWIRVQDHAFPDVT